MTWSSLLPCLLPGFEEILEKRLRLAPGGGIHHFPVPGREGGLGWAGWCWGAAGSPWGRDGGRCGKGISSLPAGVQGFTGDLSESKTDQETAGNPGEQGNKWGWSVAAVRHIPGRLQPSGAAGAAPPWTSLAETSSRSRKGARTPPSPCPFLPAPNQPPPRFARCQKCLERGNEGDLTTRNLSGRCRGRQDE